MAFGLVDNLKGVFSLFISQRSYKLPTGEHDGSPMAHCPTGWLCSIHIYSTRLETVRAHIALKISPCRIT